ncbi:SDR family NAD(P)-dependent oxidoreductase [Nonomuraea jabiensis]|uniref:3-oxoacyl-[acyl-carrier protein] reductase n=1 Tax=Nonomuraea jabiensis TaxID=882448 RepID=A0A7W9G868_9ACTN|nr:SDR family NAD(P)-dependent oxidoreductase [Nonomuraea jabiensis]MBB5779010.1 3-oxoacyl-[acyl-carrier protein] reductase [Nonomuraea jabiensis]
MMYPDLQGKVALITGGSGGIGRETARVLAEQGMRVVVNGRDPGAIEAAVKSIGGGALGVAADTTDFAAVEEMRAEVERRIGPVDVLAIFAGGGAGIPRPIDQTSEEDWHATMHANLTSTFLVIKGFLPRMRERRSGSIITMSSLAARTPTSASVAYTAAKAGIIALTRQLAHELGPAGIRVNSVAPSTIMTDRLAERMPREYQERMLAEHPLGRLGTPLDVANVTAFLASDASSWLTGLTIDVAGGKWMP